MRMRKFTTLLLILCLGLGFSFPAEASVRVGSLCKHVGDTSLSTDGNLVCVKVGNKLNFQRIPKKASTSASSGNQSFDQLIAKAYDAYDHKSCEGTHPNFRATYLVSANYKPTMLAQQKNLFERAMSCYNNYFDHPISINVALVTEKDYDFLASQIVDGHSTFDNIQLRWANFMMDRISKGPGRFAGSAGWSVPVSSAWVIMIDSGSSNSPDSHGAAHEFVHILQSYSKSNLFPHYGDGSSPADYVNMPTWFWEGTAELFSYESLSKSASDLRFNMFEVRNQGKESPSLNRISNEAQFTSTMKLLESPDGQEANMMCYALGSVVSEYILANFGSQKYFQIMQNAGVYKDFSENLKNSIGLTTSELYAKAAPFALSQWRENFN